jgi:hypothetical protein
MKLTIEVAEANDAAFRSNQLPMELSPPSTFYTFESMGKVAGG